MSLPVENRYKEFAISVAPPLLVVPVVLGAGVVVLYYFQRGWRWIRMAVRLVNPDNFVQLGVGFAVCLLLDKNKQKSIKVLILMVFIPLRFVNCLDEYTKLAGAWQKLVTAIKGDYLAKPSYWVESSKKGMLSPSQEKFLYETGFQISVRLQKVSKRTYSLAKRVFFLSIACTDALEALSQTKGAKNRILNEFFLDGAEGISKVADILHKIALQREEALRKLEEHRELANKFLKHFGASFSADFLIDKLSSMVIGIDEFDKTVRMVSEVGNGIVGDVGRHVAQGLFSFLGIAEQLPSALLPGDFEEKVFEKKSTERYVPQEYRTQPAMWEARKKAAGKKWFKN